MPWTGLDNIITDLERRANTLPEQVGAVVGTLDEPLTSEMQQGATWEDQTGNARTGLQAETTVNGTTVTLSLFDDPALTYVWWLLTCHGGRYDIISRTAEILPSRKQSHSRVCLTIRAGRWTRGQGGAGSMLLVDEGAEAIPPLRT